MSDYQYTPMLQNSLQVTGNSVTQPAHEVTRDRGDGVHVFNVADGTSREVGITRMTHSPDADRRAIAETNPDPMASLKSNSRPGEPLNPRKATILWQGFELDLASAAKIGVIREDGPGRWVSTSAPAAAPQASVLGGQQQPAAPTAPHSSQGSQEVPFLPETVEAIASIQETLSAPVAQAITARAVDSGDIEAALLHSGVTNDQRQELGAKLAHIRDSLVAHANHALTTKLGVSDPADFHDWAATHRSTEFRSSKLTHLYGGSAVQAYGALARDYLRNSMSSTAALQRAGANPHMVKGEEFVTIGGYTLPAKAARRAGLIS